MLIAQDLSQLHNAYGKDESITGNCGVLAAYPPQRQETAEFLSKLTGETTVERVQVSRSHNGVTRSVHESGRRLLTPDECRTLPGAVKDRAGLITAPGQMLLFLNGYPAIKAVQPLYFQDEVFQARAAVPPSARSDVLRQTPLAIRASVNGQADVDGLDVEVRA
jgi:type IV secretion system protein VirD4